MAERGTRPRPEPDDIETTGSPADGEVWLGMLGDFIGFHLRLAQEASYQAFFQRIARDEGLEGLNIKPGHLTFMALIAENPGITQTALSRGCGRDKSSLTPMVEDFVRRGYVKKRRLLNDRRSYALTLTPAGEELSRTLSAHARAHDDELDRIVGIDAKPELIRLLRRIKMSLG
ncbi:MarR family winged helix-turn-helix transcriptional regulator [Azospirillum sp. TSO35-2]|uniref:MarR family winged helix-turn-helix transcriptional regulator n=1 Tax=Azospirillum sp. TSO35-2 TaxID=716796 RepID=UPI000D607FA1|nr:MarR family winged helix-turn-helix transcriptional regulator [Azospirillum sp. TSO35-2]PWC36498.1 hypothetical protein TSO352_15580 [Azospirillum sp. TSO35-2]